MFLSLMVNLTASISLPLPVCLPQHCFCSLKYLPRLTLQGSVGESKKNQTQCLLLKNDQLGEGKRMQSKSNKLQLHTGPRERFAGDKDHTAVLTVQVALEDEGLRWAMWEDCPQRGPPAKKPFLCDSTEDNSCFVYFSCRFQSQPPTPRW